jgi:hypothetical protein
MHELIRMVDSGYAADFSMAFTFYANDLSF